MFFPTHLIHKTDILHKAGFLTEQKAGIIMNCAYRLNSAVRQIGVWRVNPSGQWTVKESLRDNLKGTSKNYPFGFWADLLPSQCVLKIPQYIQYSGISKTFVRTKSLAQNTKK